jgi:superfamily II DNA helicase RecQ
VPAVAADAVAADLNAFLARHRVVSIKRELTTQDGTAIWAVCVEYLTASGEERRPGSLGRSRVDYKQLLPADEFAVFARLREIRKEIAQEDAVPVYAVFTNEQLAQVVQLRCRTPADLRRIEGVGEARIEKYADRILEAMTALPERGDETAGQSDPEDHRT